MKEENCQEKQDCCRKTNNCHCHHHGGGSGTSGAIYGLGVIGALFYFLQGVVGFVPVLIGIGKAFFWPAFIVFKALTMLKI
jgi:hypothetical protein